MLFFIVEMLYQAGLDFCRWTGRLPLAPVAETGFSHRLTPYKIGRSYQRLALE